MAVRTDQLLKLFYFDRNSSGDVNSSCLDLLSFQFLVNARNLDADAFLKELFDKQHLLSRGP